MNGTREQSAGTMACRLALVKRSASRVRPGGRQTLTRPRWGTGTRHAPPIHRLDRHHTRGPGQPPVP